MTKKKGVQATPAGNNPRKITAEKLARLRKSEEIFGDISGITVNTTTGQMVTGHQRTSTMPDAAPVITHRYKRPTATGTVATGYVEFGGERFSYREVKWTPEKADAAMIAANTHAGEWDNDILRDVVNGLKQRAFDLELTGLGAKELAKLTAATPAEDAGAVSVTDARLMQLRKKWDVQPGDVWQVGPHRIVCGDSTKLGTYAKLMVQGSAQLLYTDPPYGVTYKADGKAAIANDDLRGNKLANFLIPALRLAHGYIANDGAAYIWHASSTRRDFEHALDTVGLVEKQYLTWIKDGFVLGHADYHWQTEPCFYCEKAGHAAKFFGDRTQATVWRITQSEPGTTYMSIATGLHLTDGDAASLFLRRQPPKTAGKLRHHRLKQGEKLIVADEQATTDAWEIGRDPAGDYLHPTQKPVALAERAIVNSTKEGQIVLDNFHGAGATMVACERLKRICRAVELDPGYVAVALERLSELGQKPEKSK